MTDPTGLKPRKLPTRRQVMTAKGISDRIKAGEPPSKEMIIEEHLKNYKCDGSKTHPPRQLAATIAGQNFKKPHFLAALSLTDPDAQIALKDKLWTWLDGNDPNHPKDKQLAMKAADLLSKGAIAQREQVVHTNSADFDGKSIDELRFFELYDRFPNEGELEHFKLRGTMPASGVQ